MTASALLYDIRPKLENSKRTKSTKSTYCPRYYIRCTATRPHRIATKTHNLSSNQPPPDESLPIPSIQPFIPDWFFHLPPRLSKHQQSIPWCIPHLANDKNISAPDAPTDKPTFPQLCFPYP